MSKIIFAINFIPSLCYLVYHITTSNINSTIELEPSICMNICTLNETTIDDCNNLWIHLDNPIYKFGNDLTLPQTHLVIMSILVGFFIFSIIESIMEMKCYWTPYYKLYQNVKGFTNQIATTRNNRRNKPKENPNIMELHPL